MVTRMRKSAYSPGGKDDLVWYAKAVAVMKTRATTDPTSWTYQAGMHGYNLQLPVWQTAAPFPLEADMKKYWTPCEHHTWYFLPWHRMFLAYFEQIAAAAIIQAGGPSDWALPFWDYSETGNAAARTVPPAFQAQAQAQGTPSAPNSLWCERNRTISNPLWVTLEALKIFDFAGNGIAQPHGFGGPEPKDSHSENLSGALEQKPHALVHSAISGLMAVPETAALDPLFWIHHANIDRLWQVWLDQGGRHNPPEPGWLNKVFLFHNSSGIEQSITPADVLDSTTLLGNGYRYQSMNDSLPAAGSAPAQLAQGGSFLSVGRTPPAELMAASNVAIPLSANSQGITLRYLPENHRRANMTFLTLDASPPSVPGNVHLRFDNVTGKGLAPIFEVWLTTPGINGTPDKLHAGSLAFFGLESCSTPSEHQSGSGMDLILDITEQFDQLRRKPGWNDQQLDIVLEPAWPMPANASVTIGRTSLYARHG